MAFPLQRLLVLAALLVGGELRAQDFLDRLEQKLTLSAFDDQFRARLSGTLDLEFYAFDQPAPGLIDSRDSTLFNPRLTLFVDSQIGSRIYFFSQIRVDRHFDPTDQGVQIRLDEYALRVTPWEDGRFSLQVGKFATVVGNWNGRHLSWDNPFINAPLAYENATPLSDLAAPYTYGDYNGKKRGPKYVYLPVIWGPSYASGMSIAGRVWKFEYAAEVKNAALAARPESWDLTQIGFDYPTVSGRLGFRPNPMWNFGVSASDGAYLRPEAAPTCAAWAQSWRLSRELSLARTSRSPGITCKSGRNFTGRRVLTLPPWETPIPSRITWKRNTSSPPSSSARCVGASSSSPRFPTFMAARFRGATTSGASKPRSATASRRTRS